MLKLLVFLFISRFLFIVFYRGKNVDTATSLLYPDKKYMHQNKFKIILPCNNGNCEEDLPKKPVGRLSVNCRPSVDRQSADCWPTVGRVSTNSRPTVGRQSAVRRPTDFARNIGYLSADSRPTAHRQSGDSW